MVPRLNVDLVVEPAGEGALHSAEGDDNERRVLCEMLCDWLNEGDVRLAGDVHAELVRLLRVCGVSEREIESVPAPKDRAAR